MHWQEVLQDISGNRYHCSSYVHRLSTYSPRATDAGINVLQLLEEAGAAAVTTTTDLWSFSLQADHT